MEQASNQHLVHSGCAQLLIMNNEVKGNLTCEPL